MTPGASDVTSSKVQRCLIEAQHPLELLALRRFCAHSPACVACVQTHALSCTATGILPLPTPYTLPYWCTARHSTLLMEFTRPGLRMGLHYAVNKLPDSVMAVRTICSSIAAWFWNPLTRNQ